MYRNFNHFYLKQILDRKGCKYTHNPLKKQDKKECTQAYNLPNRSF